jgi:DNA-binding response OmpR family regulator
VAQAGPPASPQRFHRRRGEGALRIVIAENDADTTKTLTAILEDAGHEVYAVANGKDVLPTARFVRPDAMILDISLPGMSGYAVAEVMRHSFTEVRRPLLIAISGKWMEPSEMRVAQHVGFDHYLVKPCDPAAILELLDGLKRPDPAP